MEFHPIASIFPMLPENELQELADDIREHGLREPVWTFEGKILDGRNRATACKLAGVDPTYREFKGSRVQAVSHVWSLNRKRRHLNSSQAAIAEAKRAQLSEEYAAELDKIRDDASKRPTAGRPSADGNSRKQIPANKSVGRVREVRAKAAGTNAKYIDDAEKLLKLHPDKAEQIERGEKTITQVKRELKEEKRERRRSENKAKIVGPTVAKLTDFDSQFATIVADPPWDWGDEGDVDQLGRARPEYATLSIDELLSLEVPAVADIDCHLYLWITNRSLPKGFSLLDRWGFRYVTCLTWCKPSFGMGNYFRGSTEQVLFAVKGSQQLKRKDVGTWFSAPRGPRGHSSKPVEFYDLVESCSPGPYLELFARGGRKEWSSWGAEAGE